MDSPRDDMQSLPEGIDALRALVLTMMSESDALALERDTLQTQNDRLRHLLLQLRRLHFGPRSERLPEEQLQLGLEALEQAIANAEAEAEKRDPGLRKDNAAKRRASRGALPTHLPRIEVMLAPDDTACPCCRAAMTRRPKRACRSCAGIVAQAPAPARLIEGGIPTEAMIAHVLVARYADHLPLYRQAQILARQGVILERSTLSFWMGYAAAEVAPVVARLREMMLASTRIFADETVVPVLDPGRGRTKQGYFWAMARDDRPWGGSQPPAVVCSYAPGRGPCISRRLQAASRSIPAHRYLRSRLQALCHAPQCRRGKARLSSAADRAPGQCSFAPIGLGHRHSLTGPGTKGETLTLAPCDAAGNFRSRGAGGES